jgi:dihydroneopterin aldolase
MDKISLNDISAFGYHGVLKSEKELGQNFLIDLDVELDLREAGVNDNLDFTVNYSDLHYIVKKVVKEESFNLIESIAEKIAFEVLENIKIKRVRVKVKKPYIPDKDFSGKVSVEIYREQSLIKGG